MLISVCKVFNLGESDAMHDTHVIKDSFRYLKLYCYIKEVRYIAIRRI